MEIKEAIELLKFKQLCNKQTRQDDEALSLAIKILERVNTGLIRDIIFANRGKLAAPIAKAIVEGLTATPNQEEGR
ncbi:MAG: hypothetical protein WC444_07105 [Candidatus Paceibacterota bacterium]